MPPDEIEKILNQYLEKVNISPELRKKVDNLLKSTGLPTIAQAVAEIYKVKYGEDNSTYKNFVYWAQQNNCWFAEEKNLDKARENLENILTAVRTKHEDYVELFNYLDEVKNPKVYASILMNIPEIREMVLEQIGAWDNLYRVSRSILQDRQKQKRASKYKPDIPAKDSAEVTISPDLNKNYLGILKNLPAGYFESLREESQTKEDVEKRRIFLILKEEIKRENFRFFKTDQDPNQSMRNLEDFVSDQKNSNVRYVYEDQVKTFYHYLELREKVRNLGYINEEFENSVTGKKGVLPSFHQIMAMYENLEEGRFGVFDDCGTGKTAIAALLSPLIQQKKKEQGKPVSGRTVVIGPKTSTKAWMDGLQGNDQRRYYKEKQKVAWVNGRKDDNFYQEMKESDFIFVNYEQLTCDFTVNGQTKKVYEILRDLGYDHLIIDEVQEAKNTRNKTQNDQATESFAVRMLTINPNAEYVTLLSGTPLPDNLDDYANIFFMLKPGEFLKEIEHENGKITVLDMENIIKKFREIYEKNPRKLYTLIKEKTIRRTSEQVSDLPGMEKIDDLVKLTSVQRQIIDYVFESGAKDWLTQLRYAVLDPRLVSPKILDEIGLLGNVSRSDSAKYRTLEELLVSDRGPIAQREGFVIFSSMFAEGVTRQAEKLGSEYQMRKKEDLFEELKIRPLDQELSDYLSQKFNREIRIGVIDALTSDEERERIVDHLRSKELDGVICTTKSGGISLDFSSASFAYWLDMDYSPGTLQQGNARLVRKGQRRKAEVHFLFGDHFIDNSVEDLVENKQQNIQMALDGIELLDKEKELLDGKTDKKYLKELILKRRGGIAIDIDNYQISDLDEFEIKEVRNKKKGQRRNVSRSSVYEPTVAQEIRKTIADDPVNCWHNEEFVQKYIQNFHQLSPYLLARAKVVDLVKKSLNGEIKFPELLLADAAGHGILYSAFQNLEGLVTKHGLKVPVIAERDFSQAMHQASPNPLKFLADITGKPQVFDEEFFERYGKFDLVDCSSITLLPNREKIRDYIVEANRVLDLGGYLQLGTGGWHFSPEFFKSMEEAGFQTLVRQVRHSISPALFNILRDQFGQHYAEAYERKLSSTNFSIFQKSDEIRTVKEKYFLLESPDYEEEPLETEEAEEEQEGKPDVEVATLKKPKLYTGSRRLIIGPHGCVESVKNGN